MGILGAVGLSVFERSRGPQNFDPSEPLGMERSSGGNLDGGCFGDLIRAAYWLVRFSTRVCAFQTQSGEKV